MGGRGGGGLEVGTVEVENWCGVDVCATRTLSMHRQMVTATFYYRGQVKP